MTLQNCVFFRLTDLLTVSDVAVVIVAVLGAISMKRCLDISFPIIKNTQAPLECLEDLNRKSFLVELNKVGVTTNLAEETTVCGGGGGGKKRLLVVSAKDVIET